MNFLQAVENQLKNFTALKNGDKVVFLNKMRAILLHPIVNFHAIVALEKKEEEHKVITIEGLELKLTPLPDNVKVKGLLDVKEGETFFFLDRDPLNTAVGFLYTLARKIIYKAEKDLNTKEAGYYRHIDLDNEKTIDNFVSSLQGIIGEIKVRYGGNSISSSTVYGRTMGRANEEDNEKAIVLVVNEDIINDLISLVQGRKLVKKYVYEQLNSCERKS